MRVATPSAHSRSLARFMHREAQVEKSFNVLGTVFENSRNVLAAPLLRVRRRLELRFGGNGLARGARRPEAAVRLLARLLPPKRSSNLRLTRRSGAAKTFRELSNTVPNTLKDLSTWASLCINLASERLRAFGGSPLMGGKISKM